MDVPNGSDRPTPLMDGAVDVPSMTVDVPSMMVDAGVSCEVSGCPAGQRCAHRVCVPNLGPCMTDDNCAGDSYCDQGNCTPYGVPMDRIADPSCRRPMADPAVNPVVQCEWNGENENGYNLIYTAPLVAELNLDGTCRTTRPSIVAVTWQYAPPDRERRGVLRVFDGRTCAQQMSIGLPGSPSAMDSEPGYGSTPAIGELDPVAGGMRPTLSCDESTGAAVGHPEIITVHRAGAALQLIALEIVENAGTFSLNRRWVGRRCPAGTPVEFGTVWTINSPSIVDIDDDGSPEVLFDKYVFDRDGCLKNPTQTEAYTRYLPDPTGVYEQGVFTVAVDVDRDDTRRPELLTYDGVWRWDSGANLWQRPAYWMPPAGTRFPAGYIAVADMGDYPMTMLRAGRIPETVVVSTEAANWNPSAGARLRIQTAEGNIVFDVPLYATGGMPAGHGGPPTIADFDNDGWPEIGIAGGRHYAVYDPDCTTPPAPGRETGTCRRPDMVRNGVLWAQSSQDFSSAITGSSVFDFNGDGEAEVVYRDECYVRVYRGRTGEVIYSAPATSWTGTEYPTIADVDGDFASEIVVPRAMAAVADPAYCPAVDPLRPSSMRRLGQGFSVLHDAQDRWANSRPIWNQHAYSITHVLDDGRIPRTSTMQRNWDVAGLNNFRQNAQVGGSALGIADLTVSIDRALDLCTGNTMMPTLSARVCNRGANGVQDGVLVRFVLPMAGGGSSTVCEARTDRFLMPGSCTNVMCTGRLMDPMQVRQINVSVDPDGSIPDCRPANNRGVIVGQLCPG